MNLYHVDAFTKRRFHGNPAAVVPMEVFADDAVLQAIAAENNLSETVFYTPQAHGPADYNIRWFTPTQEVDLCGHATLAAAHVLWNETRDTRETIVFESRSGLLTVSRDGDRIVLDFPELAAHPVDVTTPLVRALGRQPAEVFQAKNTLCVFENKRDIHELQPDFGLLAALPTFGVIVTAPASGHDFVCRYFAPRAGVPEDPVTGSAHCTLVPYWAKRLGKAALLSHQVSSRGGELWCRHDAQRARVHIAGHAVTYLRGTIEIG